MRHHARLFVANSISDSLLEDGITVPGEDIIHIVRDKLRIADIEEIKKYAYQRPIKRGKIDIVIFADSYLLEAQNALLKLLEEPPLSTRLSLVTKDQQQLLPTVRSRLLFCGSNEPINTKEETYGLEFISNPVAKRIAQIDVLAKNKDTKTMQQILRLTARLLIKNTLSNKQSDRNSYQVLNTVMYYIQQNGASSKMLLEYVALSIPVMKIK